MSPAPGMNLEYGKLGILREFFLKEGDCIITQQMGIGGESTAPVLTDPMRVGNWVKLVRGATPADDQKEFITVEKALPEEVLVADKDLGEPRLVIGRQITNATWGLGQEPQTDMNYGDPNMSKRKASIDLIGSLMKDYFLEKGNSEIRPGDSVSFINYKFNEAKGYNDVLVDKAEGYNGSIVIYGAPADAPDMQTVRVLFPTARIGGA